MAAKQKYGADEVACLRVLHGQGYTVAELLAALGTVEGKPVMTRQTLERILNRQTYKEVARNHPLHGIAPLDYLDYCRGERQALRNDAAVAAQRAREAEATAKEAARKEAVFAMLRAKTDPLREAARLARTAEELFEKAKAYRFKRIDDLGEERWNDRAWARFEETDGDEEAIAKQRALYEAGLVERKEKALAKLVKKPPKVWTDQRKRLARRRRKREKERDSMDRYAAMREAQRDAALAEWEKENPGVPAPGYYYED